MDNKSFDTNSFFVGGAGMFIQYHDVVKSVYLMAIFKMIWTNESLGLPISMINKLSMQSLIEWYLYRRYQNPLLCLDPMHIITPSDKIDEVLINYLDADDSLYRMAPKLNTCVLLSNYKQQHMNFPITIYSERYEKNIENDIRETFPDINIKYVYGELGSHIKDLPENYTYIFSNIELVKLAAKYLDGHYAHILLSDDYRYNYKDNFTRFKYDLNELAHSYTNIRIGLSHTVNSYHLAKSFTQLI